MPGYNGAGPLGYGMGSGRRMGPCFSGGGRSGGYGRRFFSRKEETEMLKEEVEELEKELTAAKERLSEVEGEK